MAEVTWQCDCPICRLIVYPIIRRISPTNKVTSKEESKESEIKKNVGELTKGRPIEMIKLSDIEQQEMPQGQKVATVMPLETGTENAEQQASLQTITYPSIDLQSQHIETQEKQQYQEQNLVSENKEKNEPNAYVPKDLYERLGNLESEIDKIKKYVKASIDGIKATLVDLRSAMAELSNPFNILRKYADILLTSEGKSEKGEGSVREQQYVQPQIVPIVVPLAQGAIIQPSQSQQQESKESIKIESKDVSKSLKIKKNRFEERNGDEEVKEKMSINPDVYEKLISWINSLLNRVPLEGINKLIDNYVLTGILGKGMGETLKMMAKTISELKSVGLSIKEQAKYLRELLNALNTTSRNVRKFVTQSEEIEKENDNADANKGGNQVEELLKIIDEDEDNEQ